MCPITTPLNPENAAMKCTRVPRLLLADMFGDLGGNSFHVDVPPITACPPPKTTPTWIDATATLPDGYGILGNVSFKTSCALADDDCYATCTSAAIACGSQWQAWENANPTTIETELTISTGVGTSTVTTYSSFSPSVYNLQTYEYAIGTGKPRVVANILYDYSLEQSRRWTDAPPTCTPSNWVKCTKGSDAQRCAIQDAGHQRCTVQGGTVRLFWWPSLSTSTADATGSPLGTRNNTGAYQGTSLATAPHTTAPFAMLGNRTLTWPSVYISFQTAYATNDCGHTVGQTFPGALLPVDPSSLYSMQGDFDYFVATSSGQLSTFYPSARFNFDDVTGLVPVSVYIAQPSCIAYGCFTVYPDYAPVLVRDFDPAWKSCALDWRGAWDPPVALTPQAVVASVTMPGIVVTTSAAAPQSGISAPAQQTQGVGVPSSSAAVTDSGAVPSLSSQPTVSATASPSDGSAAVLSLAPALPGMLQSVAAADPVAFTATLTSPSAAVVSPLSTAALSNFGSAASTGDSTSETEPSAPTIQPSPTNAYQVFSQAHQSAASLAASPADPEKSAATASSRYTIPVTTSDDPGSIDPPSTPTDVTTLVDPTATAPEGETVSPGATVYPTQPDSAPSSDQQDPAAVVSPPSGPSNPAVAVFTLASETFTAIPIPPANGNGQTGLAISVASQTIAVNSDSTVLSGHTISAATNGVVVDGTLLPFSTPTALGSLSTSVATLAFTLGGTSAITASLLPQSAVQIGTQTLRPGSSAAVVHGHTFSAVSSGIVEDGSTTLVFPSQGPTQGLGDPTLPSVDPEIPTTARAPSTGTPTGLWSILASRSLTPNGPALVLSGHTFTAVSNGLLEDGTLLGYTPATASSTPITSIPTRTTSADASGTDTTTTAESTAFFLSAIAFGSYIAPISDGTSKAESGATPALTAVSAPTGTEGAGAASSTSGAAAAAGSRMGSFSVAKGWLVCISVCSLRWLW
ncbi:hypothetical protein LTR12_017440 [Friedmanniomyces endolithicus]|nr:hypothetical protein LTR12_017440 [Friedmanniomyces endolithicus]